MRCRLRQSNLQLVTSHLKELGYDVLVERLKASQYGIPQRRVRLYLVGLRASSALAEDTGSILKKVSDKGVASASND